MKPTIEIQPTAMTGQSILVMRDPEKQRLIPIISLQMPTEIAQWIKKACEESESCP